MKLFVLFLLFVGFQNEVPFKPSEEFQVNIDLAFKIKSSGYSPTTFSGSGEHLDKQSSTTLPYLTVIVGQIKIENDEIKVEAIDSRGKSLLKRKVAPNLELRFQMGFVDDLKNGTSPNEVTLNFLSKEKKKLRKIVFSVSEKGVFEVNGKWHGQF